MKSTFVTALEILIKVALKQETFYDKIFTLGEVKGVIEIYNKLNKFNKEEYEMLLNEVTNAKYMIRNSIKEIKQCL